MSDLIVLEELTPATVFKEGGGDPVIEKIKQEVLSVDRDISTDDGRKHVASLAYKVARSKTLLDEMGKTFAADLKKQTKAIDTERARIWDALEALQQQVRQPLTEFEDAEKTRIQAHEEMLLKIETAGIFDGYTPSAAQVQDRLAEIPGYMQRDWQEFGKRATDTSDRMTINLQKLLAERQKHEAEQAELERLRKAEADRIQRDRDEQIKTEAAESARREAEAKAQREAEAAEQKAKAEKDAIERQKQEAEERAAKAEREQKDAEARAAREKEEAVRKERQRSEDETRAKEAEAAKREADLKHRASINNAALQSLVATGLSEEHAKMAVEAIARRQIAHVTISY